MKNHLYIFCNMPVPGEVKQRIAAAVGAGTASEMYRRFIDLVVGRFSGSASWKTHIACRPSEGSAFFSVLYPETSVVAQGDGGLGERMERIVAGAFGAGAEKAVMISADSPTLPLSIVNDAFAALDKAHIAAAPATDGGCVSIGIRKDVMGTLGAVFKRIDWGGEAAFGALEENAARMRMKTATLSTWHRVHTTADLDWLEKELRNYPDIYDTSPAELEQMKSLTYLLEEVQTARRI